MCGFVGYFGTARYDLTDAARAIEHRGPDMRRITTGSDWAVAFNRLSILDLTENGMQPFTFDGVTVYLNGEIYNYIELRERHRDEFQWVTESDVEIVPFLYRKYGLRFLHMLNGMFAMVIIDERHGRRLLVRDRFGKKPLFYTRVDDTLLFASEIKALKRVTRLRPDRTNIALNLSCWFLIQPLSLYEGVVNVNPGCYVEVDGANTVERRWYEPRVELTTRTMDDMEEGIMDLYRDSVRLRLRSDVPVGIYLSGGLDSVSMAHLSRQISPANFSAFTARIKDKESWELNNTDTEVVARYCAEHGLPMQAVDIDFDYWDRNIVRIVGNYEELFTDMGVLVFYALAEAAHQSGVKVLFSGVGGDELFGGYPWQERLRQLPSWVLEHGLAASPSPARDALYGLLCRLRNPITDNRAASMFRLIAQPRLWHAQSLGSGFNPYMLDMNRAVAERIDGISVNYFDVAARVAGDDVVNRINYANVCTVLGNQNYEVDVASMMHSIENRSPLLDYRLVEYMLSVPDSVKVAEGQKGLMRRLGRRMLPTYVTEARKSGPGMPVHQWLAQPQFQRIALAFLVRHKALIAEVVSEDLARHVGRPSFHQGWSGALMTFALICLVIWARQNLESRPIDDRISFTRLAAES